MKDWFHIQNIEKLDSPALVLYPERIRSNIQTLIESVGGNMDRLRPHIKTHKSIKVIHLCQELGISRFKCATLSEAEILGICKAPDVLLAYQPLGPKLIRYLNLIENYPETRFSCLIDNIHSASDLSSLGLEKKIIFSVYLDLNVGMNRTGIKPLPDGLKLFHECKDLKGIEIKGLHVYDGHIHVSDLNLRQEMVGQIYTLMEEFNQSLGPEYSNLNWIMGGSPSFPIHSSKNRVECSPGTFIYWDFNYQNAFPEQKFKIAALVISRVISHLDETHFCLDLGHKSVGAENPIDKRVYFLNAPELKFISQSEEHLVVESPKAQAYSLGTVFYGIPYHICPTVALYERAMIIQNHQYIEDWKIEARDRKIHF